jgi:threonine/homoserine/homoserine lactone efflux protein
LHYRPTVEFVIHELTIFLGTCLLLTMVPGPGAAVILRQAVRDGRRSALMTMLGQETALVLWGVAAAAGLSALIAASEVAFAVMRVVGAVVLMVLGVQALRTARRGGSTFEQPGPTATTGPTEWQSYRTGLVANVTNPKIAVFSLSFLPQFVPAGFPVSATLPILAVLWGVVDTIWYTAVIWCVGRAKELFGRSSLRHRLTQLSGMVLIGLGLRLALDMQ